MKQLVLEKIVVSGFPPVNKRCLWLRGNTFYYWYKGAWRSIDSVDIDEEYVDDRISEVVSEEITKVIGNAPEEYDTLGELAQYASEHKIESEERDTKIDANTEAVEAIKEKIAAIDESSGWIAFE